MEGVPREISLCSELGHIYLIYKRLLLDMNSKMLIKNSYILLSTSSKRATLKRQGFIWHRAKQGVFPPPKKFLNKNLLLLLLRFKQLTNSVTLAFLTLHGMGHIPHPLGHQGSQLLHPSLCFPPKFSPDKTP